MAQTGLRIKTDIKDVYQRITINSSESELKGEPVLLVSVFHCDQDWTPQGAPLNYYRTESESEFHTALRKDAAEKEQLITQFCTDPEWNPEGYSLDDDQFKIADPNEDPNLEHIILKHKEEKNGNI